MIVDFKVHVNSRVPTVTSVWNWLLQFIICILSGVYVVANVIVMLFYKYISVKQQN